MKYLIPSSSPHRQRGATLVVALLVLVLIMMISISAIVSSNTQYKLAGNLQFEDSAMNNAEAAISAGENWLASGSNYLDGGFTTYNSTSKAYLFPSAAVVNPLTQTWSNSNSIAVTSQQRYYIQLMSLDNILAGSSQAVGGRSNAACNKVNTYEITALGLSARGAKKVVRSYFSVLNC